MCVYVSVCLCVRPRIKMKLVYHRDQQLLACRGENAAAVVIEYWSSASSFAASTLSPCWQKQTAGQKGEKCNLHHHQQCSSIISVECCELWNVVASSSGLPSSTRSSNCDHQQSSKCQKCPSPPFVVQH